MRMNQQKISNLMFDTGSQEGSQFRENWEKPHSRNRAGAKPRFAQVAPGSWTPSWHIEWHDRHTQTPDKNMLKAKMLSLQSVRAINHLGPFESFLASPKCIKTGSFWVCEGFSVPGYAKMQQNPIKVSFGLCQREANHSYMLKANIGLFGREIFVSGEIADQLVWQSVQVSCTAGSE